MYIKCHILSWFPVRVLVMRLWEKNCKTKTRWNRSEMAKTHNFNFPSPSRSPPQPPTALLWEREGTNPHNLQGHSRATKRGPRRQYHEYVQMLKEYWNSRIKAFNRIFLSWTTVSKWIFFPEPYVLPWNLQMGKLADVFLVLSGRDITLDSGCSR